MKKLKTLFAVAVLSSGLSFSQTINGPLPLPDKGKETFENPFQDTKIKNFKEYSIGFMYMPIPLYINEINVTQDGETTELTSGENIFNSGYGLVFNVDFQKSGFGLGFIGYYAFIGGDEVTAGDLFGALKYDVALGDKLTTNFEISPLLGIGSVQFDRETDGAVYGSSLYFSGGGRITWRLSNWLFLGGDVLLSPVFFNPEKLLGVEGEVDEVKIKYKTPVTVNFSLRFSL